MRTPTTNHQNQQLLLKLLDNAPENIKTMIYSKFKTITNNKHKKSDIYMQTLKTKRAVGREYHGEAEALVNKLKAYMGVKNNTYFMNDLSNVVEGTRGYTFEAEFFEKYHKHNRMPVDKELIDYLTRMIDKRPRRKLKPRPISAGRVVCGL
jgi:hypothetical protein